MHLKITAPDQIVYKGIVDKVTLPTASGQITIFKNHQPLGTVITSGTIILFPENSESVDEGYKEQLVDGKISIAVDRGLAYIDGENIIVTVSV